MIANKVLIILANNHLCDKLDSILHETNSFTGYRATLEAFGQTRIGNVYKQMISFGYSRDEGELRSDEISSYSDRFQMLPWDDFVAIVKEFEAIENEFEKHWTVLGGNIPDKLYGWMYEWMETVAYAYNPEKWEDYKMLYEHLDIPFTQVITGEGVAEAERMLLEEAMEGAN